MGTAEDADETDKGNTTVNPYPENADVMEEVSKSEATVNEIDTKSTNNRKSPGPDLGPLGYQELIAEDADETEKNAVNEISTKSTIDLME